MRKKLDSGVVRVNFDIPREIHRRLKTLLVSRGISVKDHLISYIEKCVGDVDLAELNNAGQSNPGAGEKSNSGAEEKFNPGAGMEWLKEQIEEILEAKLIGLNKAGNPDGIEKAGNPDGIEKAEKVEGDSGVYTTKPMEEKPLEVHTVKPVEKPVEKPVGKPVEIEKSAEAERVILAEDGVVAKKVVVAEKKKEKKRKPFFPHEFE